MISYALLRRRLRSLRSYNYDVPWCVPPWGWRELRASMLPIRGRAITGPNPSRFATAIARELGVAFALPFNRGRTAIGVALRALEIEPGSEVVVPAYVCETAVDGIRFAGMSPVFADVADNLHVTVQSVAAVTTASTRCILVPHLFGGSAPIAQLEAFARSRKIALIDDAAQSFGARVGGQLVGTFGDCGIVSVGPGKSLAGPAGAVLVTNDEQLFRRALELSMALPEEAAVAVTRRIGSYWIWRRLRRHTGAARQLWERLPTRPRAHVHAKMANADAALGLAQLHSWRANARARRANVTALLTALGPIADYAVGTIADDAMYLKLVLILPANGPTVSAFVDALAAVGVEAQGGYRPCHLGSGAGVPLARTDELWERVVCLPTETAPSEAVCSRVAALVGTLFAGIPSDVG